MKQSEFELFARTLQNDAFAVLTGKGKDYARAGAAFHNFETTAEFLGLKREEVLAAHLYKHFAAIFAFVREGQVETEPIRARIIDAQNYLTFLAAMAAEGSGPDAYRYVQEQFQLSGWEREQAVDIAPGREIAEPNTGPPWYLPAGGRAEPAVRVGVLHENV